MKRVLSHVQKGFTLIELLTSIAIFSVITTVAVYNNSQFNGSVLLTNLTYEVALSIRLAQTYGISVKAGANQNFNSGYGVHFDLGAPTTYKLFEDVAPVNGTPNHTFDGGDNVLQTYTIAKGNKLSKICIDSNCSTQTLDVAFVRPDPDAYANGTTAYSETDICVASPQGMKRKIVIGPTGQISVSSDTTNCN